MIKDAINTAPRWFLTLWVLFSTPFAVAAGTVAFNLVMYRLAEIQLAYGEPSRMADAVLERRLNGLEIRVSAIEYQIPPLVEKVNKIDANVEKLLKRR